MSDDYLSLGPAPRPASGDEIVERIRAMLRADEQDSAALRDALAVLDHTQIVLEGADVASLEIDATGVVISRESVIADAQSTADDGELPLAPIRTRERATLQLASVQAHPVHVADVPIDVDVRLASMPFHWVEAEDGSVGVEAIEPDADSPLTGTGVVSVPQEALATTIREIAQTLAADQGIELRALDVRLTPAGPRGARVDVDAKVRKGFLGASVRATGAASIDDDLVLRFEDVSLSSGNVIVAGLLATVRGKIERATSRPIPLGDELPDGIRVTDLRIDVGPTITLSATLG